VADAEDLLLVKCSPVQSIAATSQVVDALPVGAPVQGSDSAKWCKTR